MKKILLLCFLVLSITSNSFAEVGTASWYGGNEKLNKYTASGEVFNSEDLTCASWYYPFGTYLKVTNIKTSKTVIIRVNDRGPAKRLGRIIDLSKEAFSRISNINKGLIKVRIEEVKK